MPARRLLVHTPLDGQSLLVKDVTVTEQLGRLSQIDVDLLSPDEALPLKDLLGKGLSVELAVGTDQKRYFHGLVAECTQTGRTGRYASYSVRVVPWLWLLTRATNCRIFQKKSVPDIIKDVFRKHGQSDFEESLNGNYPSRDYCVQYMETDFNFVSRLMEEEGIYYFFRHEKDKHTLVLCDGVSAHGTAPGYENISYFPPSDNAVRTDDHVFEWLLSQSIQSGKFVHTDYDFIKPRTSLQSQSVTQGDYAKSDYELYEYPGGYLTVSEGERYAQSRLEAIQHQHERTSATGNVRGVAVGCLFNLDGYPRDDQNREYLVVSALHRLRGMDYESGASEEAQDCFVSFHSIPSRQPYRSPLVSPKTRVAGPQTAVVVGKSGEEIWTDEYGRVKVQFHWDREGKRDENSSCWVRVSQLWAGKNWGAMHIPRIGQEVVVSFLEGDADRPLITGRVYNAAEMPPYELPANQTQSGIKSRSTKGGGPANFNEFRFEDKKGSEQVYLHAEKNQDIVVENDETHSVGHDRSKSISHDETSKIGNNRTEKVGANEDITIGANRTEKVGANENITIAVNRTENVGANESITIGSNRTITIGGSETATVALQRTHTVGINETVTVGAAQETTVGAMQSVTVGANQTVTVGANQSVNVGSKQSVSVGADRSLSVGGGRTTSVGKDDALKVAKKLVIEAGEEVTITTGDASISLKKDGTISIKGKDITIDGSGKINVKADGDIAMKGSKIKQN